MRLLSLFMIVGYFEIYEVLMFYHGEKLWLYSGLTEILMLALLIVINNEHPAWGIHPVPAPVLPAAGKKQPSD